VTAFLAVAVAMVVVAVAWVLVPLLRQHGQGSPAAEATNLAVLRDQLAELDADLARGTLTSERYEQAKLELERRVLDEVNPAEATAGGPPSPSSAWAAAILGAAIPVAAVALYLAVGAPGLLLSGAPSASGPQHEITADQLDAMVAKLAAHVEKNPDDVKGWSLLARSYYVMARYPEAVRAYGRAAALAPRDADLLADYADALGMTHGRNLQGKPLELVERALAIDPDHWKALALAGTAAFDRKDYGAAIAYWERLKRVVPADSQIGQSVEASIAEARELGGAAVAAAKAPPPAGVGAKVAGRVSLAPALAAKTAPTDTVFVFARAASGPPMPLAVLRKQVKDLPLEFALDDSMAMAPNLRLSGFAEVIVGARISRSGSASPASGDLQGLSRPVKVGATGVAVVIDSTVP
jgi:cytochrome c-type biogenesis protein CcmH